MLACFLQAATIRFNRPMPSWTSQQMQQWQKLAWKGNVRELRNFADRLTLGAQQPEDLTAVAMGANELKAFSLVEQIDRYERSLIAEALRLCDTNVADKAGHLGIPKKTLYDKIKKYQLGSGRINSGIF